MFKLFMYKLHIIQRTRYLTRPRCPRHWRPPRRGPSRASTPTRWGCTVLYCTVLYCTVLQVGLQCYSCGSLLNPNKKCDEFSREDPGQVQTCLKDEACLLYSWRKSATETATLRECFPTRVLLGTIRDPLAPLPDCSQRDITDDGSGSIFACLCNTDFCNDDRLAISPGQAGAGGRERPRSRPSPVTRVRQCPADFDLVDGDCYFLSTERVGWIEARKKCEVRGAQLISFDTSERKRSRLAEYVRSSARRRGGRRSEFWTSGNDISREGAWQWAEQAGNRSVNA